jgi:hypothetical protein
VTARLRQPANCALAAIAACAIATTLSARAQTPARDAQGVSVTAGSASISGTVVSDDERRTPLRRVVLTLSRVGVPDQRQTATDDRGRFLFASLPAAVYTISAARGGYVAISYGAARPGQPASPIPLADGQNFVAAPLPLMRGGVIAGRLTNPKGRAVANTIVQAAAFRTVNGQRKPLAVTSSYAETDAHGAYRIHSLPPGEYLVSVSSTAAAAPVEMREMTASEIAWAEQQTRPGSAPAAAVVTPAGSGAASGPVAGRPTVYAPTYFPGAVDLANAGVVTIARGEERTDVNFQIQPVATARVAGIVTGPDGRVVPGTSIYRAPSNTALMVESFIGVVRLGVDGRFTIGNVAPGDYTLVARASLPPVEGGRGGASTPVWGAADIHVQGADIPDVAIQLTTGVHVSGRLVFDGAAPAAALLSRFRPRLAGLGPSGAGVFVSTSSAVVDPDQSFRADAMPGQYRFSVATAAGWFVKSATSGGRDILDAPIELRAGSDVTDIVVTFSDRPTEISGTLTTASGTPAPALSVLLYSADRTHWTEGSRWVQTVRAGVDGTFKLTGLPPGDYYLCALTELEPGQMADADFLAPLVPASIRLSLADGEKRVQNLRVGG